MSLLTRGPGPQIPPPQSAMAEITRVLTLEKIAASFSLERQLRNVDKIFARVFHDRQS